MCPVPVRRDGILVLDKPRGPSSHQVAAWAGEILGCSTGHAGTLDPAVSGVLVVMLGRAVRLAPILLAEEKEYIALLRLHADAGRTRLEEAASGFTGRVYQRPPRRSAVARNLRIRNIHSLEILGTEGRLVLLRISCDAGTYIRSLCHHLGLAAGTGGHMQELRRIRSGMFREEGAVTLHELKDACILAAEGRPEPLNRMILPMESVVAALPKVVIRDSAVDAICHGAALAGVGIVRQEEFGKGAPVAVVTEKDELVCLGESLVSSSAAPPGRTGLVLAPRSVFMPPGTYPRIWKKKRSVGS